MPPRGTRSKKPASTPANFSTDTPPRIAYEISFTKNLGDYESLRVSARVELDADFEESDLDIIDKRLELIREHLTTKLQDDVEVITGN